MTVDGFSAALLVTALALVFFAIAGAITWGLAALLPRLPVTLLEPQARIKETEKVTGLKETVKIPPVTAPHAGQVAQVSVLPGQTLHFAQTLFIINTGNQSIAIRSAREGTVGEVRIVEGDTVQAGQVLMEYAEPGESKV
jgi:biotin carboxyl carrier protein